MVALLEAQIGRRNSRRLQTAMRSARLPALKTLADCDVSFQPSVKRDQLDSLHSLGFLDRHENVILRGPPGVGKTHRALSSAGATVESGRHVYYATLAELIASLEQTQQAGTLEHRLKTLGFSKPSESHHTVRPRVIGCGMLGSGLGVARDLLAGAEPDAGLGRQVPHELVEVLHGRAVADDLRM